VKPLEQIVLDARTREGMTVRMVHSGTEYTAHYLHPDPFGSGRQIATLRRATPKLSKQARKAAKRRERDKWRR
jgi:hypothetical protein